MVKKILLADDSITIQKVVELTFSEGEYEVICVNNGAQAIRKAEETAPDIALVDVMMPQRNGYDVCAHIKQHAELSWMPVLLLTGTFEPFDPRRAEQVGADGHITKPFESRALVAQVEELLAARPRPRAAQPEPEPIAPSMAAGAAEIVNAGQIFAAGAEAMETHGAPRTMDDAPSSATVRIDTRAFLHQTGEAEESLETEFPASHSSLGPLDLAGEEDNSEPTHPVRAVTPELPAAPAIAPPAKADAPSQSVPSMTPDELRRLLEIEIHKIVRPIVKETVERIIREVAWEVIPEVAEQVIRRRIREIEEEAGRGDAAFH